MSGESWVIAISVGVIAIAFAALVVYLIITLVSLRKTIETTSEICRDLENKIHAFDPYVRMLSGVGKTIEKKAVALNQLSDEVCESIHLQKKERAANIVNTSLEVAEWAMLGLALWQKIKDRR